MIKKVITDIDYFFDKGTLSRSSILIFMQQIRLLLELKYKDERHRKYKTVNLYCNWLLHTDLNRGFVPQIIKNISKAFDDFNDKGDLIRKVNKPLLIKQLIIELKEILSKNLEVKKKQLFFDFVAFKN